VISERRVRLFRNGKNQAVRIPRDFELPGKDAVMRKAGERLIVEHDSALWCQAPGSDCSRRHIATIVGARLFRFFPSTRPISPYIGIRDLCSAGGH
jgi:virulence-associated protein VagC